MRSIIDSISNQKIKYVCKISDSSSFRKENGQFVLEGLRLCVDAALSGTIIDSVFYTKKAYEKSSSQIEEIINRSKNVYEISQSVCAKLSQTENSQGVFCLCEMAGIPAVKSLDIKGKYIALDNIQNPDNLGAISRTAEALGIKGVIIKGGCDIYNPKALRASMGSLLRLEVFKTENLVSFLSGLKNKGMKIYSTTPDNKAVSVTKADMSDGVVCVIGNEANGVSDEVMTACTGITIPMLGKAESLNAAMAAAITMWEMVRSL